MRALVLRPEPGAGATAARIRARGGEAVVAPLFRIEPEAWIAPEAGAHDALLLTSANAVRQAGPALAALTTLPVYAVGAATATAAREAGLTVHTVGTGDAAALLATAGEAGVKRPLHLTGAEHMDAAQDGLLITRRIVYRADPVDRLSPEVLAALEARAVVLLHSPRAAALFAQLLDQAECARADVAVAAISAAAMTAAGEGWRARAVAVFPTDDALLAAAALLCETGGGMQDRTGA
jgi:uroporphyrinogen-III synthase